MYSKIGFLMPPTLLGEQNGVVSQALTWRKALEEKGITVQLINPWCSYEWSKFDVIHAFSTGHYLSILPEIKKSGCKKIILSPIFDHNRPSLVTNALSRIAFPFGELRTTWATFRLALNCVDRILARSTFEAECLISGFGIAKEKILIVPLSVRFCIPPEKTKNIREQICSHVSILSAPIKNVKRLVKASEKFGFSLHLAGNIKDQNFKKWLETIQNKNTQIVYHGVLDDDQLLQLYQRSKVFALPSLMEGVGLVALEAAINGADIVITERGGPKEYYGGLAHTVNPQSVDEIGTAIMSLLGAKTHQPELAARIASLYSINYTSNLLINSYDLS